MLTLSTSGEGAKSLLLRVHLSTHQFLLHCTLNLAIHFNGSNGTAYARPSKVHYNKFEEIICELVFPVKNRKIQGPTKKDIGFIQGSSF